MAKKTTNSNSNAENGQRQSRKEILIARKQERQMRNIRIALIAIVALMAIVIGVALINELILTPNRAVANVGATPITLRDWQDRVRYERAQRVIFLENQLEAFGGDVGIVQQFGGQVMTELLDPDGMGQNVLNLMADEQVICQALEDRGIGITDADIDEAIGESYGYYGGASPTAEPSPTTTIAPTPSLTPIPTPVITEVVPSPTPFPTLEPGPTAEPQPTATPVPEAYFQEQYGDLLTSFSDLGVDEATYRAVVRVQLCRERLAETLADEQALATIAPHASLFIITVEDEAEAADALAQIESSDFLTVWNTLSSRTGEEEDPELPTSLAFELLWRSRDNLEASVGAEVAAAAFELPLNEPSEVIAVANPDGTTSYFIIMVSGREERELAESELQAQRQELLQTYVDDQLAGNLEISEIWRSRVPNRPVLDPKFLVQPTPAPTTPPAETLPTVEPGEGE